MQGVVIQADASVLDVFIEDGTSFQGPALAVVVCFGRRSKSTKETVLMPPRSPTSPPLVSTGPPRYRCVECSHPVSSLYTIYSKDNVRLTQCVAPPF